MQSRKKNGVTIVELTVVILILSILASIAAQVYVAHLARARVARCFSDIAQLELAAKAYYIHVGSYPVSSSGTQFGTSPPNPMRGSGGGVVGCGYLMLCLQQSLSGNPSAPTSARWSGPYLEVNMEQLGDLNGLPVTTSTPLPQISLLDPWGRPYQYIRHNDYREFGGTEQTRSPFLEVFFNPSTFQIYSMGPNGETFHPPEAGMDKDDINNWDNRNR